MTSLYMAIDDKHSVVGILQALSIVLGNGGKPERTLYVAFGHDEEVSGHGGAGEIAKVLKGLLEENNEKLDFLLDEGMFVMQDVVPGVDDPVIYIGVVEKGWTTLELTVNGDQSHSSAPPRESTIGILAKAVSNLEKHRSPAQFSSGPEYDSVSYLAPMLPFYSRWFFPTSGCSKMQFLQCLLVALSWMPFREPQLLSLLLREGSRKM